MTLQPFAVPHYKIEFHHTDDWSELEIYDNDGEVITKFVNNKALKIFSLLMAFPTQSERDIYIENRVFHLLNIDF